MSFFLISVVGGLTPGASAPGKPPWGTLKTCYAHGEESRRGAAPSSRQQPPRRHDPRPRIDGRQRRQPMQTHQAQQHSPGQLTPGSPARAGHRAASPPRPAADARQGIRQQPHQAAPHGPTQPAQRKDRHRRPTPSPRPTGRPQPPPAQIIPLYTHRTRQPARKPASGPRWTTTGNRSSHPPIIIYIYNYISCY